MGHLERDAPDPALAMSAEAANIASCGNSRPTRTRQTASRRPCTLTRRESYGHRSDNQQAGSGRRCCRAEALGRATLATVGGGQRSETRAQASDTSARPHWLAVRDCNLDGPDTAEVVSRRVETCAAVRCVQRPDGTGHPLAARRGPPRGERGPDPAAWCVEVCRSVMVSVRLVLSPVR